MTAVAVRRLVLVVCVLGIAGMIVTSILGRTGAAIAFGMMTAVAVLCSMTATAVTAGTAPADTEVEAARLEDMVEQLVESGADERAVRALVRQAVRLGKGSASA